MAHSTSSVRREEKLIDVDVPPTQAVRPRHGLSILLLGATGVGKSTFIATTTGAKVEIGHGVTSCTTDCQLIEVDYLGNLVTLIDTPGFDDTSRDDLDTLGTIASFMNPQDIPPIAGVVYFQRITDRRVTGLGRMNLRLMQAICGPAFYPHVILCTTMWNTVTSQNIAVQEECLLREKQLMESPNHWEGLIRQGARCCRFTGDRESGLAIIDHMLQRRAAPRLAIEVELRQSRRLEETAAASIILEERRKREERLREEMRAEREEEEERLRQERESLARASRDARGLGEPIRSSSHRDDDARVVDPHHAEPERGEGSSHVDRSHSRPRTLVKKSPGKTRQIYVVEVRQVRRGSRGSNWRFW